jgi:hypothetical protein
VADQRPCSCGGSNENCALCFGRGFIEISAVDLSSKRIIPTPRQQGGRAKGRGFSLPSALQSRAYASAPVFSRPAAECPLCKAQVRVDRLSKHLARRCPQRPNKSILPRSLGATTSAALSIRVAAAKISATKGRNEVSPEERVRVTVTKNIDKSKVDRRFGNGAFLESLRDKGESDIERPSWWDNLDATKNRGYPAREEGRYGSYPSHDGFDDESKP